MGAIIKTRKETKIQLENKERLSPMQSEENND